MLNPPRLAIVALGILATLSVPAHAQRLRRIVDMPPPTVGSATISDDGSVVLLEDGGAIVRRDLPAATSTVLTAAGYARPSVSDDGTVAAVYSNLDPLGLNPDGSGEVFLVSTTDGSVIDQLTAFSAGTTWFNFTLAGDASRVALEGPIDPLGSNPGLVEQVFVTIGSRLVRQTTAFAAGIVEDLTIADDGSRVALRHVDGSGDATAYHVPALGGSPTDVSSGIASNPRRVAISGDGSTVGYEDAGVVTVDLAGALQFANPAGTNLSLADDGTQFYDVLDTATERSILGGAAVVLDPPAPAHAYAPLVSGDGSAVVFRSQFGSFPGFDNDDGSVELGWAATTGSSTVALTATGWAGSVFFPAISRDGTRVAFAVSAGGWNSAGVYVVQPDGFGLRRLTFDVAGPQEVSFYPGGDTLAFLGHTNLLEDPACDATTAETLFSIQADGSGLTQLRACDESLRFLEVYDDGIVVEKPDIPAVLNVDAAGLQLNVVDGGLSPVTNYREPRADDVGEWVAFKVETAAMPDDGRQIWRSRTDGTLAEPVTNDPVYLSENGPDISADGTRIVFDSRWDPLGTNTDHNLEIFLAEYPAGTITQLTDTTTGSNLRPLISGNGAWVWFASSSGFGGAPGTQLFRLEVATGRLERLQGLANGTLGLTSLCEYQFGGFAARLRPCFTVDHGGHRGAVASGVALDGGAGGNGALYLVEFDVSNEWALPTDGSTDISWQVDPRYASYDVLRGDLAALAFGGGGTVSLGDVVCLEHASVDTIAPGGDIDPAPGEGFFYLYRGSAGSLEPETWGSASGGENRVPASGDCS